jgi:two-component system, NarL family, response regulator NreC
MVMSSPIRVIVVDDHAVLREGLAMVIDSQDDIECAGQAADNAGALALLGREHPRVAVVDLSLGAEDGLLLVKSMRDTAPETRILVLTQREDRESIRAALVAGAAGYVLKRGGTRNVVDGIRALARGETYIDPSLGLELVRQILAEPAPRDRLAVLTGRERQVFEMVALGDTHRAIAERLGIGKKSVDTYRGRIYQKLGIGTRAELVAIALSCGVLARASDNAESRFAHDPKNQPN